MSPGSSVRILYVAYPLLPVSETACGGAEQVLVTLEKEMSRRGHRTALAACAGSSVSGELFTTGGPPLVADDYPRRAAEHHACILDLLHRRDSEFDLLHDMSGAFWRCAAVVDIPVLATLHLPTSFYGDTFHHLPGNLFFNCVSHAQARSFGVLPPSSVIQNGIDLAGFPLTPAKRDYLLWLGRMCEEKGAHLALDAATLAGLPIVLAGQVYPFSYHQRYFEREITPRIASRKEHVRLVEVPSAAEKVELLRHARALLLPSSAEETSSLVAMEAMSCGTPVIAFRRGALPEVVAHGVTGWLADSLEGLVAALEGLDEISPQACRDRAAGHYSHLRMADEYEALYSQILQMRSGSSAQEDPASASRAGSMLSA